ncbi:YceD family protein [Bacillus sp. FJAT-44742]|uniref:YceD family protein n=1 Tax=Bacillus sp. FJAT-44742 TaxID=2014005 RepID=UPI000C238A2B|nr:YceD family protein [Bacillus sp. FJAT-44742]
MKWSIQELLAKRHSGLEIQEEQVDVSELVDRDKEIRRITPVNVTGRGEFTGQTVNFTLRIQGSMVLPCSRTLADVELPFDVEAQERFLLTDSALEEKDEDTHEPVNGFVDLLPYVKEHILLQIPIQIFAENGEEPQAPQEGQDWEVVTEDELKEAREEEKEKKVDPRLADLAKYFDK